MKRSGASVTTCRESFAKWRLTALGTVVLRTKAVKREVSFGAKRLPSTKKPEVVSESPFSSRTTRRAALCGNMLARRPPASWSKWMASVAASLRMRTTSCTISWMRMRVAAVSVSRMGK
ncbi:PP227 [Orf virus]|uniref:PP227 n=1 Tax=Orf virus TaxID=10258 RepID=F1AXA2_ORFV|nr:PP227 [Orf virus]